MIPCTCLFIFDAGSLEWVLIIFGTQVIKKKRTVRPVFLDYLSVSYGYGKMKLYIIVHLLKESLIEMFFFWVVFSWVHVKILLQFLFSRLLHVKTTLITMI